MSSEWPTVQIDQVCELIVDCVNKTAPVVDGPTPYRMIRTTNIRNGRLDLSGCRFVDEATHAKWTRRAELKHGDVLLTREAPIGEVGLVLEPSGLFLGQRVMQYRADESVLSPRFLLYSFLSPYLQHQFGSHEGSGSVVSHIRVGDCFKFKLRLPPFPVQTEIAALLGALDDRIALLSETNATLEALAQALFKSWFIDFDPVRAKLQDSTPAGIDEATSALFPESFDASAEGTLPMGWERTNLAAVTERFGGSIQTGPFGSQLHASDYVEEGIPVVMPKDIQGRRVMTDSVARIQASDADRLSRHKLIKGDIVFSRRGDVERHALIGERETGWLCGTGCLLVRPGKDWASPTFLSMMLDAPQARTWLVQHAVGATMPNLNTGILGSVPVVLPPPALLHAFEDIIAVTEEQRSQNASTAETLASIRDALLPRLISGQLRLPQAEALLEEATA
jgi:type I restriction enzyme S subunit